MFYWQSTILHVAIFQNSYNIRQQVATSNNIYGRKENSSPLFMENCIEKPCAPPCFLLAPSITYSCNNFRKWQHKYFVKKFTHFHHRFFLVFELFYFEVRMFFLKPPNLNATHLRHSFSQNHIIFTLSWNWDKSNKFKFAHRGTINKFLQFVACLECVSTPNNASLWNSCFKSRLLAHNCFFVTDSSK